MSNSKLVDYTKISPNRTPNRKYDITRISIHCVVGQCSVETIGNIFAPASRQASCNYGIGPDGRIGMYCEEKDRSWCTSSPDNDHRAITIETASDTYHPYAVKPAAYEALLDLCEDICRRNEKKKLIWISDKTKALAYKPAKDEMQLTVHRWFANKACPGEYLYSRHGEIAKEVTKRLSGTTTKKETTTSVKTDTTTTTTKIKKGDLVSLSSKATYYDGDSIPPWVKNTKWYVEEVSGSRAVINKSQDGKNAIMSAVNTKYLTVVKTTTTKKTEAFKPYTVKVTANALNIRDGAGTNYKVNTIIRDKGVYTIVEEKTVSGLKWGKLKSGAGWISLQHTKKI